MMKDFNKDTCTVSELSENIPADAYPVVSASTMSKFLMDCQGPALARLHQIRGTGAPAAMKTGSFVHEVQEVAVNNYIDHGKLMDKGELGEIVKKKIEGENFGDGIDGIDSDEEVIQIRTSVTDFATNGLYAILQTLNDPQSAEQKLYYTHQAEKHNHEMIAIIDIVDVDPNPGRDGKQRLRVRDLKTSATFAPDRYLKSPQMSIYTAAMTANGMPTDTARVDHLRRLKRDGIKYSQIGMVRGREHWRHIGTLLDQLRETIDHNKFTFNPGSWLCNEGCPLWDRCEFKYPIDSARSA